MCGILVALLSSSYGFTPTWTLFKAPPSTKIPVTVTSSCCFSSTRTQLGTHTKKHKDGSSNFVRQNKTNLSASTLVRQIAASAMLAAVVATTTLCPLPSHAASYGSFTDEQKLVAEAWRLVDNSFLDRTFNGQDWFQLRQDYVLKQAKTYKSMFDAQQAIDRMVSTLGDKYTRYLSPAKYQSLVDSATGSFAGVGVEIGTTSPENGRPMVSDLEEKSPASNAGLKPGDVFVEVDGTKFDTKSTPDDVAIKLRGPKGSKVGVVVERDGKTLDFILTREPITITAVRSYLSSVPGVPGKIGVIRIKNFSSTTASKVASEWAALQKKGAQSLVVDVRGNPGGLLPGGVDTASLFLDDNKPIVFVVNKNGVVDAQSTLAQGADLITPLVVLVDSNTASAAEVFSAALQENGRATVVGEKTFGKGIVQTIRELSGDNGGLAITVARYETPQHHDINKQGIPVDVETPVSCPKDDAAACLKAPVFSKSKGS